MVFDDTVTARSSIVRATPNCRADTLQGDWSQLVIDEMELFPKGRYDDLTDSTTMAVSFLRTSGILQTDAEAMAAEENTVMHRPRRLRALYPC
jgi:phage terminase large subunit-like protein